VEWRNAVTVVRAHALEAMALQGAGRATAFDFAGTGGHRTWVGTVVLEPGARTGAHHHGRHEVAVYVVDGCSEIRWGERLEFSAEVAPGDFVYFAPHVPHQERNLSPVGKVRFVVARSDNERIVFKLDIPPVERPERIF
jgi:uncharacterized RmlC-like cupin family protein